MKQYIRTLIQFPTAKLVLFHANMAKLIRLSNDSYTSTNQRRVRCHVSYYQPMNIEESFAADAIKDKEA